MARCQECDSQVAANDVFCPFCGVRQQAVGMPAPEDDASANATTEPSMTDVPIPQILADLEISPDYSPPGAPSPVTEVRREPVDLEAETAEEEIPEIARELNSRTGTGEVDAEIVDIFQVRAEAETGISKPLGEPSEVEEPRSMFDSVRIMESGAQPAPEAESLSGPEPAPGAPVPSVLSDTSSAEPKPYTEPSLGQVDTDGKRGSKLKPLSEGTVLNNRYEIVRKIGGGGMGAVYLASDNNLGGVLRAVKEMVQSHIEEEQQAKAVNDFKRESMILSTLDHPSIPTIYDYFYDADEGRFYLVMKYISGGDLSSRLRSAAEGKIDEKTATQWAIQITDVLDYLHSQPSTIVYRDLKPSNIMIDGNSGRVMLIDFGIARSISQKEEKGVTAVGTMGYAPPELFSGNVEPRSDVYSLGSTIFHLLTGADPQSNPLLIFDFQKNPRPRQINSQLSDQIERIIMRAVEYNADSRFVSAAEMKAVLEEHLANLRSGNVTYGVTAVPASISLENQSVFCGFCGQRIVATDLFCAFCGAKQPIAQQGVHSEIYARSAVPTAKLIIEGTSELATPTFSLQKDENLVGRRDPMSNIFPEVDLSKYDPQTKISRRHARIWREGGNFLVEDLGSSNGTVVASVAVDSFRLVPHRPHILSSGDKLKVGDTTLHFLIG
ncbi:MAG TPA: protein kinase [Pyrinomonadaceae bacterium]|nr:protein kinase [Pyrinomonadaceae bacterium]